MTTSNEISGGAAGKDWAQFRADLASAQETWWGDFSPTILTNTYLANLSATAYQFQVDATYLSASTSAAEADAAYIVAQAQSADNQIAADARANRALAVSTAEATYDGSAATADDLEQYQESQATGGSYNPSADDATAGATYTLAMANANATNVIALAQDQADATTTAAEATAAWTQAQDAATLSVTVTESQAYAAQQMNLASLSVSTYTQMGDSYATAAADFATASPSPWANEEAATAAAAATSNDAALLAWLANQKSTLAANSQAEITAAQADAVFSDQSAASIRAAALSHAAQALATVRATQLANLAETQYNPAGSAPAAPSAPNLILPSKTPGIDSAYSIARSAASDYNLSTAAASAHAELVHAVYSDPWSGWWTGTSPSNFNLGTAHSTSVYNGLGAGRLDAANDVSGYFIATDGHGNYINLTIDGPWHGGWNDGAVQGIFIHGISVVDPSSQTFTTFINAHAPQPQGSFDVQAVSFVVGIGVGVLTAEFGPIIAGAAGMAAANATSAFLNGELAGHSAEQIVYDTLKAGAIGAVAGAAGGAASLLMAPIATGLVGTLGLTCENGLGAVGAFIIGGADGAAFGASSSFVQVGLETGDVSKAIDAAGQSAMWGGLLGGTLSMGLNAISPFVCFAAGMQVDVDDGQKIVTKNVEDVKEGDSVVSRDENDPSGPLVLVRVDATFRKLADHLRIVEISDSSGNIGVIETTDEHPFFEKSRGQSAARDLRVGDVLVTRGGEALTVSATRHEEHPQGIPVYNFRVPGTHTYFVRPKGWTGDAAWVHNDSKCVTVFNTLEQDNLASIDGAHHVDDYIDQLVGEYQEHVAGQASISDQIQNHHLITNQMVDALDSAGFQGGQALRESESLQYLSSPGGHVGYEDWHRQMDMVMVQFIQREGSDLTADSLLEFIHNYYQNPTISWRIPGVDLSWGF